MGDLNLRTKLFLIVLGVVLVLGISPFLLPMAISASEDDDLVAVASENPLRALIGTGLDFTLGEGNLLF